MRGRKQNRTIAELERWAADPAGLARLESLVLVCQRAVFIKSLLGLSDSTFHVRHYVRMICERHGAEVKVGHGPGYDGHLRYANLQQRYACGLLLGWLLKSGDGGLVQSDDGLDPKQLLDRLLCCYQRYLNLFVTTAARADVSFEMFYNLYQANSVGDVSLHLCKNCGSRFIMLRTAHHFTCAVCAVHRHVQIPEHYRPIREAADTRQRAQPAA